MNIEAVQCTSGLAHSFERGDFPQSWRVALKAVGSPSTLLPNILTYKLVPIGINVAPLRYTDLAWLAQGLAN